MAALWVKTIPSTCLCGRDKKRNSFMKPSWETGLVMNRNTRSSWMMNGLVGLAVITGGSFVLAAETPRVLADQEFFTKGSFIAYASPWSTFFGAGKSLKHGVDYADEIVVRPDTFPANVDFSWHWPLTPPKDVGVYGYHALSFGSYDGGEPETAIRPRQVKMIRTLTERFRFSMARPIGDFNVLSEFFLTKTPGTEDKIGEIGFFLHASKSAVEFADAGEQLGSFTDANGRIWKVGKQPAPHGPYYMFIPAGDVLEGAIDFKAALDFLRVKGAVTGEEWFNGLAFGIEPVTGSGSLHVESFSVRYE